MVEIKTLPYDMTPETETNLRRACAISLFSYIYGEPYDIMRIGKSNLLQLTQCVIVLDFTTSIGEQVRQSIASSANNKAQFPLDNYNTALFQVIADDDYYNDLYLEFNIQNKLGGECYVFSRRNTNEILVSFRGSDTLLDLLVDATVETAPLRFDDLQLATDARIHRGFYCQLTNYEFHIQLAKIVETFINRADAPITVKIIGHSLGSALGCLFAYYLHHHFNASLADKPGTVGFPNIEVYTNGSPTVGNSAWVRDFNAIFVNDGRRNQYRLINEHDITPNVHIFGYKVLDAIPSIRCLANEIPPPPPDATLLARFINQSLFDYKHVGTETYVIVEKVLRRVDNATHVFAEPTVGDLLNIANTHMLDYQRWLSKPV